MTASLMYNRPFRKGNWASSLIWGRNHFLPSGENFNGYLVESTLRFANLERVWTRIENVDRSNELLLGKQIEPSGFVERFLARVQAYTFGYDHDFRFIPGVALALGGQVTFYAKPQSLTPIYGEHPAGALLFIRIRPNGGGHGHGGK